MSDSPSLPVDRPATSENRLLRAAARNQIVRTAFFCTLGSVAWLGSSSCSYESSPLSVLAIFSGLYAACCMVGVVFVPDAIASKFWATALFMCDSLICGGAIASFSGTPPATIAIATIAAFTWILIGGLRLAAAGAIFLLAGHWTTSAIFATTPLSVCPSVENGTSLMLLGYLVVVAILIHREVQRLHRDRAGVEAQFRLIAASRDRAERAILSSIPKGVSTIVNDSTLEPDVSHGIAESTVMWLRLKNADPGHLVATQAARAFRVADAIRTRFGFEVLGSLHGWTMLYAPSFIPISVVREFARELQVFGLNHGLWAESASPLRVFVHRCSLTIFSLSPTRLSFDIEGEARQAFEEALQLDVQCDDGWLFATNAAVADDVSELWGRIADNKSGAGWQVYLRRDPT